MAQIEGKNPRDSARLFEKALKDAFPIADAEQKSKQDEVAWWKRHQSEQTDDPEG